jgi:hypothetical protein
MSARTLAGALGALSFSLMTTTAMAEVFDLKPVVVTGSTVHES